jgi:hypothetical protein
MTDKKHTVYTINRKVMALPFKEEFIKKTVHASGLVGLGQKNQLVTLEVVARDMDLGVCEGDVLYVAADMFKAIWAKTKYEHEGKEVILVPMDAIDAIGRKQ